MSATQKKLTTCWAARSALKRPLTPYEHTIHTSHTTHLGDGRRGENVLTASLTVLLCSQQTQPCSRPTNVVCRPNMSQLRSRVWQSRLPQTELSPQATAAHVSTPSQREPSDPRYISVGNHSSSYQKTLRPPRQAPTISECDVKSLVAWDCLQVALEVVSALLDTWGRWHN